MARPKGMFNKRDKEKQRQKEKQEKREKMEERKASNQGKGKSLEDMMAYVDEDGNIVSTPIDPEKKRVYNVEDIEIGVPRSLEVDDPRKEGRVDYFDTSKGFGFIIQSNGIKVFFHINQTNYQVSEGDIVTFTVERGPKGLNAVGVEKKV